MVPSDSTPEPLKKSEALRSLLVSQGKDDSENTTLLSILVCKVLTNLYPEAADPTWNVENEKDELMGLQRVAAEKVSGLLLETCA